MSIKTVNDIDVVILAGGLGTRLRAVLPNTQKVVAPVDGKPFLLRLLAAFRDLGVRRVILALGHLAENVINSIKTDSPEGLELVFSIETEAKGTAGAVKFALGHVNSERFIVANGDSFIDADLSRLIAFHQAKSALISLVVFPVNSVSRYGSIILDNSSRVLEFTEKGKGESGPGLINAGVYLFERSVFDRLPVRHLSLEHDVLPHYCSAGLYGIKLGTRFIDIGVPDDYVRAESFFHDNKGGHV